MNSIGADGGGSKGVREYVLGRWRQGERDGETDDITVALQRDEEMFSKNKKQLSETGEATNEMTRECVDTGTRQAETDKVGEKMVA